MTNKRLRDEHGAIAAETTVREYVRWRRRELGLTAQAFCPQVHDPGVTAEVDWGEATVVIAGELVKVGLFLMRSCFSGACFVMAFETQSQQAFFEGHVAAFSRLRLGDRQDVVYAVAVLVEMPRSLNRLCIARRRVS